MSKVFLCALFSLSTARVSHNIINHHVASLENKIGFDNVITATVRIPKKLKMIKDDITSFARHVILSATIAFWMAMINSLKPVLSKMRIII